MEILTVVYQFLQTNHKVIVGLCIICCNIPLFTTIFFKNQTMERRIQHLGVSFAGLVFMTVEHIFLLIAQLILGVQEMENGMLGFIVIVGLLAIGYLWHSIQLAILRNKMINEFEDEVWKQLFKDF